MRRLQDDNDNVQHAAELLWCLEVLPAGNGFCLRSAADAAVGLLRVSS